MDALNYTHIGESHLSSGRPCQDASASVCEKGLSIAIVSDGHGWPSCFRSDVGSKAAVKVAEAKIREFISEVPLSLFSGEPYTARGVGEWTSDDKDRNISRLCASIVAAWDAEVEKDFKENPVTEAEISLASNAGKHSADAVADVEKFKAAAGTYYDGLYECYGCTLIAAAVTSDYWFAIHIGDGKCLATDRNGDVTEPVPWDSKCYDNVTTSLCGENPLEDFRFCYGGKESIPQVLLLCSDGLEDSYLEEGALADFMCKSVKLYVRSSKNEVIDLYRELFPTLSKTCNMNRDDISVSMIIGDQNKDNGQVPEGDTSIDIR